MAHCLICCAVVIDMLSQIREKLLESKKSNSFSSPNEEGSEGKLEGEHSEADAMELVGYDKVND